MNNKAYNWIVLIILAITWGSSFILMKRGLDAFSSGQVAALRIFIAFLVLLPFAYSRLKKAHLVHWKGLLGQGVLGNFIPAFLFTKAETGISSSLTGMLNSLTPLFTLLFGVIAFQTRTGWKNVLGIIVGFIGAIGLLAVGRDGDFGNNLHYGVYVLIATVCYALSVQIIKKYLAGVDAVTATVLAFLPIGLMAGIYLFSTDFVARLTGEPLALQALLYISILAIFGTAISVILFNQLIHRTDALFASSVTYLIKKTA